MLMQELLHLVGIIRGEIITWECGQGSKGETSIDGFI